MKAIPGVMQFHDGSLFTYEQDEEPPFALRCVPYVPTERLVYHGPAEGFMLVNAADYFERINPVEAHEPIEARQVQLDSKVESMKRTVKWLKARGNIRTAAWLKARL